MCDIEFKNVSFSFGKHKILDDISFVIKQGEFVSIIGQNGSGKSVLAKHVNGLLLPSEGDVFVDGINTKDESNIYNIRQKIGFMFQEPDNQIVGSTVEEDISFGLSNLGVERNIMRRKIDKILKDLDIYKYKNFDVNKLSGGIKQKLILAGILVMDAKCLILDEPTSMLDPVNRKKIMNEFIFLNKTQNITLILITHHMSEAKLADKIFLLESGKIFRWSHTLIEDHFLTNKKLEIKNNEQQELKNEVIIELKNLSFKYEKKGEYIIKDLNFKIRKKEVLEITGPNGSGKSTFLYLLKGILSPTSGEILLNKKLANKNKLNKKVGLIFQIPDYQFFGDNVLEEVSFGPKNIGFSKEESHQISLNALKVVGIDEKFFNYSPFDLSGGMKKLVSIASVLSMNPEILIFDEPTSCLDSESSERIINLIIDLNYKYNKTIILVHHELDKDDIFFQKEFITSKIEFPQKNTYDRI